MEICHLISKSVWHVVIVNCRYPYFIMCVFFFFFFFFFFFIVFEGRGGGRMGEGVTEKFSCCQSEHHF